MNLVAQTTICLLVTLQPCLPADVPQIEPYPVPASVLKTLEESASQHDIFLLGEAHGTQEVPAIALALLPSFERLGYDTLALEIPSDQRTQLSDWAAGKTGDVPEFFAQPSTGGRGNIQMMSLIRSALSNPHRWNLVCFDLTKQEWEEWLAEFRRINKEAAAKSISTEQFQADEIRNLLKRERSMTVNFVEQRRMNGSRGKTLVICGNLHSRLANKKNEQGEETYWPSLAALLKRENPASRIESVNVEFHQGTFFGYGRVNAFKGSKIEAMEINRLVDGNWNWALHLPTANAATFLSVPKGE